MTDQLVAMKPNEMQTGPPVEIIHQVLLEGNLDKLSEDQRLDYVGGLCQHLGITPAGKPFDLLRFQGKMVAYPNKGCAEQLRLRWRISIDRPEIVWDESTVYVTVTGRIGDRTDTDVGSVVCSNPGEKPIAVKKALTQAKRRVTLSLVGLSMFNEEDVPLATVEAPPELPPASDVTNTIGVEQKTRAEFVAECKKHGERLVDQYGTDGKAAYRQVLLDIAGVNRADRVAEVNFDKVLLALADAKVQADGDILSEVKALEAEMDNEALLEAWDAAIGVSDDMPALEELNPEQLTAYRDALKQ